MGKSLNSLVRMQSWRVDERRRELSSARAALDRVLQLRRELEEELTREQKVAGESPNLAGFHYDNYAEAVILRRERFSRGENAKGCRYGSRQPNAVLHRLEKIRGSRSPDLGTRTQGSREKGTSGRNRCPNESRKGWSNPNNLADCLIERLKMVRSLAVGYRRRRNRVLEHSSITLGHIRRRRNNSGILSV